jgi:hypothetical protein
MKKFFLVFLLTLFFSCYCFGAASVSSSVSKKNNFMVTYTFIITAASDGTVTTAATGNPITLDPMVVMNVEFIPDTGDTAPSDDYDVYLEDIAGLTGGNELYTDRIVVSGVCTDNVGADVIRIKEDSAPANEADGAAFTSPYTMTLTSSGAKSVHLRCWDAANNSNTAVQNIYFRPVSIAGGGMN